MMQARPSNTLSTSTKMCHALAGMTKHSTGSSIKGSWIDSRTSSLGLGSLTHWFPSNPRYKSLTSDTGNAKLKLATTSVPPQILLWPEATSSSKNSSNCPAASSSQTLAQSKSSSSLSKLKNSNTNKLSKNSKLAPEKQDH